MSGKTIKPTLHSIHLRPAEIYPVPPSEETQGRTDRYIAPWLARQKREDIVLATKVSGFGRQQYLRADGSLPRVNEKNIVESVDSSLKRLGTDYVDLLQIHWVSCPELGGLGAFLLQVFLG